MPSVVGSHYIGENDPRSNPVELSVEHSLAGPRDVEYAFTALPPNNCRRLAIAIRRRCRRNFYSLRSGRTVVCTENLNPGVAVMESA
jgi:hypothetical protein